MIETVKPARLGCLALVALVALAGPTVAQQPYPSYPGSGAPYSRNPVCVRLEAQLASVDRGNQDPSRVDQIRRLEDVAGRLQYDLDRVTAQGRRMGCEGRGFFALFGGGQPQQCGPINNQIQQLRANLDRALGELERTQGNSADRESTRRGILAALGQNDCGPQYRSFANRGFFENLFGPGSIISGPSDPGSGNTFRTVCVRVCDGYYFPISYSTVASRFGDDEKACQAMCPAAEVMLYTHRNPGEDMAQAVSVAGQRPYSELPNAFAYRKSFNPACSCKGAGQTWADALKHLEDQTVEQGDIVVSEERARLLSQPQTDAQGKPIRNARPSKAGAKSAPSPAAAKAAPPPEEKSAETEPGKRQVRTVGPAFYQVR